MPYLTDSQMALARRSDSRPTSRGGTGSKLMAIGEGLGGAAAVGFARGKFEDSATGQWNVPGTQIDFELLTFVGLASVALMGGSVGLGAYKTHAANLSSGVGGHYLGQVMRKFAKTGEFNLIAGGPTVAGGLPPWDPTSYDPTQFSSPYADQQAMGLASSGV